MWQQHVIVLTISIITTILIVIVLFKLNVSISLLRINRMQQHAFYSTKERGVIKVSDICRELPQGRYIVFSKAEEGVSVATLYDVYNCPLHIFLVYGEGARRSNRSF